MYNVCMVEGERVREREREGSLEWISSIKLLKVFISMSVSHFIGRYTLTHHLHVIHNQHLIT